MADTSSPSSRSLRAYPSDGDLEDAAATVETPLSDAAAGPTESELRAAERLFGERLPLAIAYARALATDGVVRGLIGPREAPRLWERHLLNCAVVAELISPDATVVDVGSGAGLPGIVLAVARPDLSVILLEPLARRAAFLSEVVTMLGLVQTTVVRARAEECVGSRASARVPLADVVTARALAPLDRLVAWCLPLAAEGGRVLALKGSSAADEVSEHRGAVLRLGGSEPVIHRCGVGTLAEPTTVVELRRLKSVGRSTAAEPGRKSRRGR